MKFVCSLITVEDINISRLFYIENYTRHLTYTVVYVKCRPYFSIKVLGRLFSKEGFYSN